MSKTRISSRNEKVLKTAVVAALCLSLGLLSGARPDKAEAAAPEKKVPPDKCANITVEALFRDGEFDAIRSDYDWGLTPHAIYLGYEDSLACLMETQDNDFILGTTSWKYETTGIDRKVVLDFSYLGNPAPPFDPLQIVEVLIRSDYILSETNYENVPKRLILWFTVGRTDYKLYFDGQDQGDTMTVTQTGVSPNRVWTMECDGLGRLEGGRKTPPSFYLMPFKITILETSLKTCL